VGGREGGGFGERVWESEYSTNTVNIVQIPYYANRKMIPVETIPGMRGGEDKGEWWMG
jgi:hypothetical protein